MPSPMVRRSIWALACAGLLAGLIVTAALYLASTRIVRDRIAVEMSAWSGYRVEIGAPPEIDFWPRFRAVLTDVRLMEWGETLGTPVATAERVEITLSTLAALRGDTVFKSVRIMKPELQVERGPAGIYLPRRPGGGRIASAIDAARKVVRDNPDSPDSADLPDEPFGSIRISDGRITIAGDTSGTDLVSGVSGTFDWPALDRWGRMTVKGTWRGEEISVDVQSDNLMLMLAGGQSTMAAKAEAASGVASFSGTARFGDEPYVDGKATFNTPSFSGLAQWVGARLPDESEIGAASLSSNVSGDAKQMKFDDANIEINGNRGTGAIELSLEASTPKISGSLAFETLDVGSLLEAFAPLTASDLAGSGPDQPVGIDLRMSAARAKAGSIELTDVAATAQIKDALAAFDISDATAFGGTVQAGLRFDRKPDGQLVEMRLLASDVDGGAFGAAAGMTSLVPIGRGTVSLILKGRGDDLESMLENADGSVSANFGAGALSGFDLAAFLKRTKDGGFFSLDEVSKGNLPIDGMDLEAAISKGVARIGRGEARMGDRIIRITGIVPYIGRGLALTGTVGPAKGGAGSDEADFFVGGSWNAPFISPTLTDPPLE